MIAKFGNESGILSVSGGRYAQGAHCEKNKQTLLLYRKFAIYLYFFISYCVLMLQYWPGI